MITLCDINNRKNKLIQENNIKVRDIDYDLFKKKPNKYFMEKCLKGWKSLHVNESMALVKAMSLVYIFMESNANTADKNRAINIITEDVIPSITNIKESKSVFKKYNNKIWYSSINESINSNIECDTILNNQKKLNKRINIESRFINCRNKENILDTIDEVCYDIMKMPVSIMVRYNVALENVNYTINKLGLGKFINRKEIYEAVTDNFLIGNFENDFQFYYMNKALQENSMFEDMDYFHEGEKISNFKESVSSIAKNLIKGFMSIPQKTPEGAKKVIKMFYAKSENNIIDGTPNILIWIRHMVTFSTLALSIPVGALVVFTDNFIALQVKKSEVTKMIDKYNKELEKTNEKIKTAKDEKQKERLNTYKKTLEESLNKLKEYRETVMTDKEIEDIENKENGIDDSDVSFESALTHEQMKNVCLIEYTASLLENYTNLRENEIIKEGVYTECLLTPYSTVMNDIVELVKYGIVDKKEMLNSLTEAKRDITNTCVVLDSYSYNDIIEDIRNKKIQRAKKKIIKLSQEENAFKKLVNLAIKVIYTITTLVTLTVSVIHLIPFIVTLIIGEFVKEKTPTDNVNQLYRLRKTLVKRKKILETKKDDNDTEYIKQLDESIKMIDKALDEVKKDRKRRSRDTFKENAYESLAAKFWDIDNISSAIYKISNIKTIKEVDSIDDIMKVNTIMENLIESERECILELNLKNTVKLYGNKVKSKFQKVKDKEHEISSNLDNAVENFMTKRKKAMENNAREQVVKGSVIPSASKVIKLALAGAVTAAVIHPAVTIVGALGALAVHKRTTDKERKYILDEIEVEKKIVERKLQNAENENDMKTIEELLKLQRKLKKEEQRIKYKMSDKILVVNNDND